MWSKFLLPTGLLAVAAVALPPSAQVYRGSGTNGSGVQTLAPPSATGAAVAAPKNPPKVFYLTIATPKIGNSGGLIAPWGGDFYVDNKYAEFCPKPRDCPQKRLPKPTFALLEQNGQAILALNTSVDSQSVSTGKSQLVYIHYTGQLRFFLPPQEILVNDGIPTNFKIVKGVSGAKDSLAFAGDPQAGFPAAPFMLCTEVGGPVAGKPVPIYQVYVATQGFKAFVNSTNCVKIVPEITYSTEGAYEWI